MEDVGQVIWIGTDVSTVTYEGMVSKAAQGEHFPERARIFVHDKISIAVLKVMNLFECGNLTIHHKFKTAIFYGRILKLIVFRACCRISDLVQLD